MYQILEGALTHLLKSPAQLGRTVLQRHGTHQLCQYRTFPAALLLPELCTFHVDDCHYYAGMIAAFLHILHRFAYKIKM